MFEEAQLSPTATVRNFRTVQIEGVGQVERIRTSERNFYQKIKDIYKECNIDYNASWVRFPFRNFLIPAFRTGSQGCVLVFLMHAYAIIFNKPTPC